MIFDCISGFKIDETLCPSQKTKIRKTLNSKYFVYVFEGPGLQNPTSMRNPKRSQNQDLEQ